MLEMRPALGDTVTTLSARSRPSRLYSLRVNRNSPRAREAVHDAKTTAVLAKRTDHSKNRSPWTRVVKAGPRPGETSASWPVVLSNKTETRSDSSHTCFPRGVL